MSGPEQCLKPLSSCSWQEEMIPIEDRGVDGAWLLNFLREVQEGRNRTVSNFHSQQEASRWLDYVPEPEYTTGMDDELTAKSFVRDHVISWTHPLSAPLIARVAESKRGKPSTFVSYTWDSGFFSNGYGVINAIQQYLTPGNFIWMDTLCRKQPDGGRFTQETEKVITGVDRLLLPMSQSPWYGSVRCISEILCAIRMNKEIVFLEYERKQRDFEQIRAYFLNGFSSIANVETSFENDKEAVLKFAVEAYGSIDAADKYLYEMMKRQLGMQ